MEDDILHNEFRHLDKCNTQSQLKINPHPNYKKVKPYLIQVWTLHTIASTLHYFLITETLATLPLTSHKCSAWDMCPKIRGSQPKNLRQRVIVIVDMRCVECQTQIVQMKNSEISEASH